MLHFKITELYLRYLDSKRNNPRYLEEKYKVRIGKKLRKIMKNGPKRGRSARNGNRSSPYAKFHKHEYKYSFSTYKDNNSGQSSYTSPITRKNRYQDKRIKHA